jgi:phosphatidylinositol alpha-1,6-mannosyltransferase
MKTLLLTEVFPPRVGGSGRWLWEIYRRLPREDYLSVVGEHPNQIEFDATHDLRLLRLPLTLRSWGVLGWSQLLDYWRPVRTLARIVRAENIRMVHCGRCLPEGLMALALRWRTGIPFACYVHGEEMTLATTSRELTWLTRRVIRRAAYLIANSHNTARILREDWGVLPEKIHVMHPGVDTQRFLPAKRDAVVRDRLGWGDRPVVLTVGRLQKRKGQDQMIRAMRKVCESVPNVLYSIVGDGEERPALEDLVRGEGLGEHVQFAGEIADEGLLHCYQQCDLFALPNRQVGQDIEGFGMVLVEAQACGKPVLAGTSGGTSETMSVPETGVVVPCDGPRELAIAVADLLSDRDRLSQMGASARQWVVKHFDWVVLTGQAEKLFRTGLIDQPNGASGGGTGGGARPGATQGLREAEVKTLA